MTIYVGCCNWCSIPDPLNGRICVIGTPQHERCMVETLKDMKGWKTLEFRPDLEKGVSLWEEVWPIEN